MGLGIAAVTGQRSQQRRGRSHNVTVYSVGQSTRSVGAYQVVGTRRTDVSSDVIMGTNSCVVTCDNGVFEKARWGIHVYCARGTCRVVRDRTIGHVQGAGTGDVQTTAYTASGCGISADGAIGHSIHSAETGIPTTLSSTAGRRVAADGAIGHRHHVIVLNATALRCSVADDRAIGHRQYPVVLQAARLLGMPAVVDGQLAQRNRSATDIENAELRRAGTGDGHAVRAAVDGQVFVDKQFRAGQRDGRYPGKNNDVARCRRGNGVAE